METLAKLPLVVLLFFFGIIYFGLPYIGITNPPVKASVAALVAFILSPRRKKIETQEGTKTQITWIFLKDAIIVD